MSSSCLEEYFGRLGSWRMDWGCQCEWTRQNICLLHGDYTCNSCLLSLHLCSCQRPKCSPPHVHLLLRTISHLGKGKTVVSRLRNNWVCRLPAVLQTAFTVWLYKRSFWCVSLDLATLLQKPGAGGRQPPCSTSSQSLVFTNSHHHQQPPPSRSTTSGTSYAHAALVKLFSSLPERNKEDYSRVLSLFFCTSLQFWELVLGIWARPRGLSPVLVLRYWNSWRVPVWVSCPHPRLPHL